MLKIKFNPIDPFTYYVVLDGKRIGTVYYASSAFYSWVFCNCSGDTCSFGKTKLEAVQIYIATFGDPLRTGAASRDKAPQAQSLETDVQMGIQDLIPSPAR